MRVAVMLRRTAGLGSVVVASAVGLADPALAKGAESATIVGPGIDRPIEVSDIGTLADLTRFWETIPGDPSLRTTFRPEADAELGPAFTVTWQVMSGPEQITPFRQDLYPYAEGGPLVYTPAGQPIFDLVSLGEWREALDRLPAVLQRLGVPSLEALSEAQVAAVPGTISSDPWWPEALAGLGAAALVSVTAAVFAVRAARARNRRRVAAIPA
jgi:hypothetical protein